MVLELANIADVPNVIAHAIGIFVGVRQLVAGNFLAHLNRFQHAAMAEPRATDVVDFAAAGGAIKVIESLDQVVAVNVVANLFTLVAEHFVRSLSHRALHQVGQKAVQLSAAVVGAGQTAAAKGRGFHVKVLAVFLHQNIGGNFGSAEQTVHATVDGHRFRDAIVEVMRRVDFPAEFFFDQRQSVGRVTVDFIGRGKNEHGVVGMLSSAFEQVQGAVGVDGEVFVRVASGPVVRGLSGGVHDQLDVRSVFFKQLAHRVLIANVGVQMNVVVAEFVLELLPLPAGRRFFSEKFFPHVVVDADDG